MFYQSGFACFSSLFFCFSERIHDLRAGLKFGKQQKIALNSISEVNLLLSLGLTEAGYHNQLLYFKSVFGFGFLVLVVVSLGGSGLGRGESRHGDTLLLIPTLR